MSEHKHEHKIGDKVKIKGLTCVVVNVDGDHVCVDDQELTPDAFGDLRETKASTHRAWHKASEVTKGH